MATIVVSSPKGGAGKSTTSVILATEFAHMGFEVTLLDCDLTTGEEVRTAVEIWSEAAALPPRITVKNRVNDKTVLTQIKENDGDGRIVIVDLGGAATRLATRAVSQADLVLVPMRASILDAEIGASAITMIAEDEQTLGRKIPYAVAFTATGNIQTKAHRGLLESLKGQGADVIEVEIKQRGAYTALFAYGGDLRTMPPQGNHATALENARLFAEAVLNRLEGDADE